MSQVDEQPKAVNAETRKCPFCAEAIEYTAAWCPFCGERLDAAAADVSAPQKESPAEREPPGADATRTEAAPKASGRGRLPLLVGTLAVLVLVVSVTAVSGWQQKAARHRDEADRLAATRAGATAAIGGAARGGSWAQTVDPACATLRDTGGVPENLAAPCAEARAALEEAALPAATRAELTLRKAAEKQKSGAPCAVADVLASEMWTFTGLPQQADVDQLMVWVAPLVCAERRPAVLGAAMTWVQDAVASWDVFARKMEEPAEGRCPGGWASDQTRRACEDNGLSWIETKPARYELVDPKGPEREIERLRRARQALRIAAATAERADLDELAEQAWWLADSEAAIAPLQSAVDDKQAALMAASVARQDYVYLRGSVVADVGRGTYEIAVSGRSTRALLRTWETGFTTQGRFSMWATKGAPETITTVNGFTQTWDTYDEANGDKPKELDKEIAAARAEVRQATASVTNANKAVAAQRAAVRKAMAATLQAWARGQLR